MSAKNKPVRMTLRYSIITGAVGFLGGILYKQGQQLNSSDLNAGDLKIEKDHQVALINKFGLIGGDTIKHRKSYTLSYDNKNRIPLWVMEHLTPANIEKTDVVLSKKEFFKDIEIEDGFRSTDEDYKNSGFSRGHLAAAMNHRFNKEGYEDTFAFSNMTPQVLKFNDPAWSRLEKHALDKVKLHDNVYVCTGPLFLPREEDGKWFVKYQIIGPNKVAVPTHFFKIIVCERKNKKCQTNEIKTYEMETYVMPNAEIDDSVPLKAFLIPKEKVESASGLRLFHFLNKSQLYKINGKIYL